jgi:hypothetical protein
VEEVKKIIVIEECCECKHRRINGGPPDYRSHCNKENRTIPNPKKIPDWCTLQDAPEEEE